MWKFFSKKYKAKKVKVLYILDDFKMYFVKTITVSIL